MSHLAPSGPQSVEHLPYPIAVAWQRVRHLTEPEQCVREALNCFDVTVRCLVALGFAQLPRERVLTLRAMPALTRPSLGHWVSALYEVAQVLSTRADVLTPQLLRWLDSAALSEILATPDAFPDETRCVIRESNLDCPLAKHLGDVQAAQLR